MAVSVLKNIFLEYGGPPAPQQRGHQNGLGVGGKAGIWRRPNGAHRFGPLAAGAGDACLHAPDVTARLPQHGGHGGQMLFFRTPEKDLSSGGGHRG